MTNLILIGMPACGKSTMGVVLAKTLGMSFIDTDLLIQQEEGEKLQKIIDERGMEAFLAIEERVLSQVKADNAVISTGGSAVYSKTAMEHLKSIGKIVYICLSLEEIQRRLKNIKTRGIAMKPGETLEDLYNKRVPLYEQYADITLQSEGLGIESSIERLMELLVTVPRRRFGLPLGADFSVWDLNARGTVDPKDFLSMGRATPFEGWQIYGKCLATFCDGKLVYKA